MGIPHPSRGYWAQRDAGQRVKKDILPPIKPHQPTTVQFRVPEFGRLDAAFNSAGVMAKVVPMAESTREEWAA
jgi:hypothetical protein